MKSRKMIAQQQQRKQRPTICLKQLLPFLLVIASICLLSQFPRTIKCEQLQQQQQQVTSNKQETPANPNLDPTTNGGASLAGNDQSAVSSTTTTATSSQQQQVNSNPMINNAAISGTNSIQQQQRHAQQQQQQPLIPPKLPKINVYIGKNEIKKLLGIDTRISYVTDGKINSYPFGFTIPMGYNQSDIIFTWQNLSPTNVNYSISLVIGNIQAVDPPLINITRSGLIPRHEQVFKITLPCSGKVTDEVDVQVLINIVGSVPVSSGQALMDDFYSSGSNQAEVDSMASQEQSSHDMQLAAAMRNQQQSMEPNTNNNTGSSDGMQSDEPQQQQQQYKLVSHTLAIKRKKICTMHPVPIQPAKVRPPNQAAPNQRAPSVQSESAVASQPPQNRWQQTSVVQHNHQQPANNNPMQDLDSPAEPAAHHSAASLSGGLPMPTDQQQSGATNAMGAAFDQDHHRPRQLNGNNQPGRPSTNSPPRPRQQPTVDQQQQQPQIAPPSIWPPTGSRITPPMILSNILPPPSGLPTPIPAENPLNELLLIRPNQNASTSAASANNNSGPSSSTFATTNPLLLTLMLMSLLVSVALVVLLMLGSASTSSLSSSSSSSSWSSKKRQPFDKLNALTSCLLRRAPASCSRAHHHQAKSSPIKTNGLIGALRVSQTATARSTMAAATTTRKHLNSKSGASSISGLSAIVSGNGNGAAGSCSPAKTAYCFKWNTNNQNNGANYSTNGYYTTSHHHHQQQQQHYNHLHHHYQLPPTADLLGTGYQCQPTAQQQQTNNYPIYHIATGNTNQTTRLIWTSNGNATSPDGFTIDGGTYMPLSNAPRSDSGSLYQTIS